MPSIKLSSEFMRKQLGLPQEAISDEITDTDRWAEYHEIVFEHDGKYYSTDYSCGATEMQYESPWEDEDNVVCYEVEKKEVLVEKWVKVD